jgi:hypothetical protein
MIGCPTNEEDRNGSLLTGLYGINQFIGEGFPKKRFNHLQRVKSFNDVKNFNAR